jgi:hypothetical protein
VIAGHDELRRPMQLACAKGNRDRDHEGPKRSGAMSHVEEVPEKLRRRVPRLLLNEAADCEKLTE